MNPELAALKATWQKRPGAQLSIIRERECALGIIFPSDYVEFMLSSNGGYGGSDEIGIEIDPIEEMAPDDAPLPEMPGLFRFGGDGAEETFAFDARGDRVSIVMVGDSIADEDVVWQGDTFTEFLRNVPALPAALRPVGGHSCTLAHARSPFIRGLSRRPAYPQRSFAGQPPSRGQRPRQSEGRGASSGCRANPFHQVGLEEQPSQPSRLSRDRRSLQRRRSRHDATRSGDIPEL
jgi:SMI1 / KNR4 family (SUKH-1)